MTDEEAIRSSMAEYAHLADDRHLDKWVDFYLETGELDVGGQVIRGHEALVEFMTQFDVPGGSTHIFSVPAVEVDGDTASAIADFVVFKNNGEVMSVGRVDDVWVRCPDRWRLRSRRITLKG